MTFRLGVAAIVYRVEKKAKGKKTRTQNKFLLFKRSQNWRGYEFLKGGLSARESEKRSLTRELKEETGLKKFDIKKTPYIISYLWPHPIEKEGSFFEGVTQSLFLVKVYGKKVRYDKREHEGYAWVTANQALKKLTFDEQRNALKYVLQNYF